MSGPTAATERDLPAEFRRFAQVARDADSPLYGRLAERIAEDPALLDLAAACPVDQPAPNLLLAAVHDLLLSGVGHPLGGLFPTVDRAAPRPWTPEETDPVPLFVDLCRVHEAALRQTLATRRVQTNEAGRIALFLPALQALYARTGETLATVSLGASAGLELLWPRTQVDYGEAGLTEPPNPVLKLRCEVREGRPPVSRRPPPSSLRTGLDLHPLDLADEADVRWLTALVWPDRPERRARLLAAATAAGARPPYVRQGDLRGPDLDAVLDLVPDGDLPVLLHAFVLYMLTAAERRQLDLHLQQRAADRGPLVRVGLEFLGTPTAELTLTRYADGGATTAVLARVHPHGRWLSWLHRPLW